MKCLFHSLLLFLWLTTQNIRFVLMNLNWFLFGCQSRLHRFVFFFVLFCFFFSVSFRWKWDVFDDFKLIRGDVLSGWITSNCLWTKTEKEIYFCFSLTVSWKLKLSEFANGRDFTPHVPHRISFRTCKIYSWCMRKIFLCSTWPEAAGDCQQVSFLEVALNDSLRWKRVSLHFKRYKKSLWSY